MKVFLKSAELELIFCIFLSENKILDICVAYCFLTGKYIMDYFVSYWVEYYINTVQFFETH